jgi:hypothetical protein
MLYLAAALCLAAAPLLMPAGYAWVRNTVSESAAQGLDGAWLGRIGLLAFGFAVICTAVVNRWWNGGARAAHYAFGVLLIAAAAFSSQPADSSLPYVATEDVIHSVAATAMGFAFAGGVALVGYGRVVAGGRFAVLDVLALAASITIPLAMSAWDGSAGLFQRLMFAVAFGWYLAETIRRPATTRGRAAAQAARSRP